MRGQPADTLLRALCIRGNIPVADSPIALGPWRADSETGSTKVVVDIA
jgi:hypothetical protein